MRKIIFPLIITILPALLSAKEIKVDYKDISYSLKQDKSRVLYQDKYQKKEFLLRDCNKEYFKIFWAQYENSKKDLSNILKAKKDHIKLNEDKKNLKINPNAKFGTFLKEIPYKTAAFEVHEKMKCTK